MDEQDAVHSTGALIECERCGTPISRPYIDASGHRTFMCEPCGRLVEEHGP